MANLNITQQFQEKITSDWKYAFQQTASKCEAYTAMETGLEGKSVQYSFLDIINLNRRPDYNPTGDTPAARNRFREKVLTETTSQNVHMLPQRFEAFPAYEYGDANSLVYLNTPVAQTIEALKRAQNREQDDVILGTRKETADGALKGYSVAKTADEVNQKGGIFGGALRGVDLASATRTYLSTTPDVSIDTGGAAIGKSVGLTIAKIIELLTIMEEREVYDETDSMYGKLVMFVTPRMINELIADEERLGDSRFGFHALKSGKVDTICNIKMVKTNRLPHYASATEITARAVMFNPLFMKFGLWGDASLRISDMRDTHVDTFSIDALYKMGSVRLLDDAFATTDCLIKTL